MVSCGERVVLWRIHDLRFLILVTIKAALPNFEGKHRETGHECGAREGYGSLELTDV